MADIHRLIAAISPDIYCDPKQRREIKHLIQASLAKKDPLAFLRAAEIIRPREPNQIPLEALESSNPADLLSLKSPTEQRTLTFDSMEESLEAIYFGLIDKVTGVEGWQVSKLVDNFAAAPGSGQFLDLTRRLAKLQQDGARLLAAGQALVKTILNTLDSLKAHEQRVRLFAQYHSPDPARQASALLALKQTWLEQTEAQRKAAGLARFRHSEEFFQDFMRGEAMPVADPHAPTDWPQALLRQRLEEFDHWLQQGEAEARLRLDIERSQLRSQVETLRLQARWAQPYLKMAAQLNPQLKTSHHLVTGFNTILFELVLLAEGEYPLAEAVQRGDLPPGAERMTRRTYRPVVIIELRFRSAPRQAGMGAFAHRGRVEMVLTSYALHDGERAVLLRELDRAETGELLSQAGLPAAQSLETLWRELDRWLDGKPPEEEKLKPETTETNPFSALWELLVSVFHWLTGKSKAPIGDDLSPDAYVERMIRSQIILRARRTCAMLFDAVKPNFSAGRKGMHEIRSD